MDSNLNINNSNITNNNDISSIGRNSSIKNQNPSLFIISCFNTFIWDKKSFILSSDNPQVKSIEIVSKTKLTNDSDFYAIIHEIHLKDKIKKLNLFLYSETLDKTIHLNEIKLDPKRELILFYNIEINQADLIEIIKENTEQNYIKVLTASEKLKIYYEYFDHKKSSKLRNNLAIQFLDEYNEGDRINYSDIIKVFCLAYGQRIITNFLNNYTNFDIEINELENKDFIDILNIYNTDKNKFFEKNIKYFIKEDLNEYKIALENFIILYKLLSKSKEHFSQKQLKNIRKILIKLINNKKDIIKRISFIILIFEELVYVFYNDKSNSVEQIKIVLKSKDNTIKLDFEQFKDIYTVLINEQEKKDKYFLDFSDVFTHFVNINKDPDILMNIKKLYMKELVKIPNKNLENKIKEKIHKAGVQKIIQGQYNNKFLIRFLKYDCCDKYKNFDLLKYFKIELMDDEFFKKFNHDKIYSKFETNLIEYLKQFSINIVKIKNFGLFFKILPIEKFSKDSISFLINWIKKYINTFDFDKCINFKEELFILFKIIAKNALEDYFINLIEFIKNNLRVYFIDIIISLLNQKYINNNPGTMEALIGILIFTDNQDKKLDKCLNLNLENINIFLQKVEMNKQYLKIFFQKIKDFSIISDDFYDDKNIRFKLFEIILNSDETKLFDENILNCLYFQNSNYNCKLLIKNFEELNITFEQAFFCIKTLGKTNMLKRIKNIYKFINMPDFENKSLQVFNNINKIMDDWQEKLTKLAMMKEFKIFISKENESIKKINDEYSQFQKKIYYYELKYLNSKESTKEYSQYIFPYLKDSFKLVEEILILRNSNIFIRLFNEIKRKEKKDVPEKALKEFQKVKNLFVENEQKIMKELKSNIALKYLNEIGVKNEDLLIHEIEWLIVYFKINYFKLKNFLIEKIKIYIKNQSLFQVLSGIIQFSDIFKDIFRSNSKDILSFEIKISEFNNKIQDLITIEQCENIIKYIEEVFKISKYNKDIFDNFFIQVYKNPKCIKFLKNKKSEHFKNLEEFLLKSEESELKEEDIKDFKTTIGFFEKHISNVIDFQISFFEAVDNIMIELSKSDKIQKSLFNFIKKFNHIEILLNKYLNGTEEWIKKLKFIFEESKIIIAKEKTKNNDYKEKYMLSGSYKETSMEEINNSIFYKPFFQNELDSMFQKSFIIKIPSVYNDLFNNFISLYTNIIKLISLLNELDMNGYHKNFKIQIQIIESQISSELNQKKQDLNLIVKDLSVLNNKISENLINLYKEHEYIRFFYPRQLINIYNYVIVNDNNDIMKVKVETLLNIYYNNSLEKIQTYKNLLLCKKDDLEEYFEILGTINKYILDQLNLNKTNLDKIYEINRIKINDKPLCSKKLEEKEKRKKKMYEGIFFKITNNNSSQEIESLNIYKYLTGNLPINACFLYCSKNMTKDEIKYFLLRSFLCEYYVLFCVINIDLLNNSLRRYFISLLKKYNNRFRRKMKSCLLLMFNGKDSDLHNILLKIKLNPLANIPENILTQKIYELNSDYKVNLVNSEVCGYGKSFSIKKEKSEEIVDKKTKEKVNYIYFPIGGKFNVINLSKRIDKLPDMSDPNKKYSIHLDITQTKEFEFLNEFFFKLMIFRKYDINTIKYFGKNVEIIIEIPNDFTDYTNEIKIFKNMKKQTKSKINEINMTEDLLFVSKILTVYENNDILKYKKELEKILQNLKLSQSDCQKIIFRYINGINSKKGKLINPNYYQLNIFIKILSEEFRKFNNIEAYSSENLVNNAIASISDRQNTEKIKNFRKMIIESIINITNLFIVSPYEDLINNQKSNQEIINNTGEEKEKMINKKLEININSYSFDNIKPSLIVFNEDGNSSTIIVTCKKESEEFQILEKLYKSQTYEKLKHFKDLTGEEIFEKLLQFLNVSGYFTTKAKRNEILGTYVYTPDNFIKVVLILMRIRMNIPVILMGETGCGKTKLIEMASQLINKGEIKIYKLNIHAGIQDDDIIDFFDNLDSKIKFQDKLLYDEKVAEFENQPIDSKNAYLKRNSKDNIFKEYENEIKERKIWIFLDEINTCNSMGLLTEIMCKYSINGRPLDSRYVFIAACNPYRVSKKENFLLNVLYKKNQMKKNLVYTVNPLPMSLMNFVFNFGSLKHEDELAYIRSMVERTVERTIDKFTSIIKNSKEKENFIKLETKCVGLCQEYVKENNDASIVSLREVNRFNIFFEFFIKYLLERKNHKNIIDNDYELKEINEFYSKKSDNEILFYALNLSLYICYYLRLPNKESREGLSSRINNEKYFPHDFLKIPEMELNYLIKNFIIPEGIAKNKSLKENLFLLFFCIINKIPLIICGKPGRSKTLSFQILQNSMKGPLSQTSFCQKYKELISHKIQGSLNTTSEEILNIFKKGRYSQEKNPDKIWAVFMDEMGLAEISENNPLKVIHAELEEENNKIAFVGISNWFIDASKMNRVVYNVVQDPDEEDLIETGKEIAKSYELKGENKYQKYENIIIKLSTAYYKFINKKKNDNDNNQYFHGSRDFYCLIRSVVKEIHINDKKLSECDLEEKNNLLIKICIKQIMRNFGGLENSVNDFKEFFLEDYENKIYENCPEFQYDVMKCLKENINDENSRYLLLITENYLSQELLNYILDDICQDKNKNKFKGKDDEIYTKYFFGSVYKSDKNNILYSNEILSNIKFQMGTNNILILKDLESVYPALYELFNQSYTYLNGKKFVYLGESDTLTLVNDNFKVIVLVDKKQIEEQEPPFLNRFEKHIINYTNLLNKDLLNISEEIYSKLDKFNDCIKEFIKLESQNSFINIDLVKLKLDKFISFINKEEIKGLVYIASIKFKKEKNNLNNYRDYIINFVYSKLVPYFSEELMILITKYGWRNNFISDYNLIYKLFQENYCYNLTDYMKKLEYDVSIIYTYSSILDEYNNFYFNLKNEKSGANFTGDSVKDINISEITSKQQIEKEIVDFIFDDLNINKIKEKNLLIFKFREEDLDKLNNIYYLLNDYKNALNKKNAKNIRKYVLFIIYLNKDEKIKNNNSISFISNFHQKMVEDLYNIHKNFPQILVSSNEEIIKNNLVDIKFIILDKFNDITRFIDFILTNFNENENKKFPFSCRLLQEASKSKNFQIIFINCLLKLIEEYKEEFIKIVFIKEICHKESLINANVINSLFEYISDLCSKNMRKIIIFLEKEQIITSAVFNDQLCQNEIIKKYIDIYISQINNEEIKNFKWDDELLNKKYSIHLLFGEKLPFLYNIFNNILTYVAINISTEFLEEDTYFFYKNIQNDKINDRQEKYKKNLEKLNNKLYLEVNQYDIIFDILKSNNKKLIYSFFQDLLFVFIKKNTNLKDEYSELSKILDLLIQIRLKTRKNGILSIEEVSKNMEITSFIDLIEEEMNKFIEINRKKINEDDEEDLYHENIYINNFISIVNFIQSYSKEIGIILEIYHFLFKRIPNLYDEIIKKIKNKEISMEISERNKDYQQVNKASFFYIIESMSKIMSQKISLLLTEPNNNKMIEDTYLKSIQLFIHNLLKLEKKCMLFSKEIFFLDIIIKIIEKIKIFEKNKNNINNILLYLEDIFSKMENKTTQIVNLYLTLTSIFDNNINEFCSLAIKIILNIYNSDNNQNFRCELLDKILLNSTLPYNTNLLEYSFPLFNICFQFDSIKLIDSSLLPKFFQSFENPSDIKREFEKAINIYMISDILEYGFEIYFDKYFKEIENKQDNNINKNLKQFLIDAIDYYYEKNKAKYNNFKLAKICKFFCIAFIKEYMKYLVNILTDGEKYNKFSERKEIIEILFNYNVTQKNSLVYYFLKLLYQKYEENWENFKAFYDGNEELKNYFEKLINLDEEKYLFCIPTLLVYDYKKENYDYNRLLCNKEFNEDDIIIFNEMFLDNEYFEYLYTFLANLMILYFSYKENTSKKSDCKDLLQFILKYLNKNPMLQDKKEILDFINLFFDLDKIDSILEILVFPNNIKKCKDFVLQKKISILYNALRFVFSIIIHSNMSKDSSKNFYINLISKKITSELDKNYIPGNFQNINLKIKTFYEVKALLKTNPKKYGAYECPCGQITIYQFAHREFECPSCKNKFGGFNSILSIFGNSKDGYYRIFFDEQTREEILNIKSSYNDIPSKLLSELEEEIENEKTFMMKGLKPVEFTCFVKRDEIVRKMKDITYRILNFILYTFIFYGYKKGNIDEKNLNKYLIGNMTPFQIMEIDWDIMKSIVGKDSVETIFNLIFEKINIKFLEYVDFRNMENTMNFEKEINDIIVNLINNKNLVNIFKEKSERILNIKKDSSKVIIQEIFSYDKYDRDKFPNFKYFYLSELPNKEHFISIFNAKEENKEKYPIINAILSDEEEKLKLKLMRYLPKINELCNYMINFVSYKYSRDEAKEKLVQKEIVDEEKIKLIKEFITIYNDIRTHMSAQYKELYMKMEFKELKLSDLCVDSKEEGFGKMLYCIYKEMIEWQNSFINTIINSGNLKLKIYKELFDVKIMIQECEDEQILEFPKLDEYPNKKDGLLDKNKFNLWKNVVENSFRKDNKVTYNFEEIENILVTHILTKVKSFKNDIREVVYQYELFIEDRSKIITNFRNKYQQRELNDIELNAVVGILLKNQKNNKFDIKKIIFSLNVLIDIIQEESIDPNRTLLSLIKPVNINAIKDRIISVNNKYNIYNITIKNFFESIIENMKINNDKYLNISCLISLLELLELFIWDNIKNDLKPEYREDIDDQIKEKFDTYNLLNNEKKIELCSAIRKFISRYLSGKKSEIYCKGNKGLKQYLLNMEFWHLKFDDIEENIIAWFGDFDLKISQALKLYEYLGGDEFRLDDIINKYKQNNKEEEKKENEEDKDEDDLFDDFINDFKDEDSIKDNDDKNSFDDEDKEKSSQNEDDENEDKYEEDEEENNGVKY